MLMRVWRTDNEILQSNSCLRSVALIQTVLVRVSLHKLTNTIMCSPAREKKSDGGK